MNDAIVTVNQLAVRFGRKPALDKIDLSLRYEESVLIAGRNGAGKSTFLKCLAGVIFPDSGRIDFAPNLDRRRIGFISDAVSLLENSTLKQGMAFHADVYGIRDFDDALIRDLGLDPHRRIKQLSAGERVLYHLGLITAQKPDLLLVDEIIHTIDPYMRSRFLDALIDLMAENRATVIMVNHAFSEVDRLPERILLMDKGRFVLDESSENLRAQIKRVVTSADIPAGLPVIFQRGPELRRECYIHPFQEEFRENHPLVFEDLDLEEIMKALIGGRYAQERNS